MKQLVNLILIGIILAVILAASGAFYTVDETQQAVITQFGEPIGQPITKSGLHFKTPFMQQVNYIDKRLLEWDGDPNEVQTLEKRYIWVDTSARWRIVDPLKFLQTVRNESSAQARLDDILDGATRDVIASHKQNETTRNTNGFIERRKSGEFVDPDFDLSGGEDSFDPIKMGREEIEELIQSQARPMIDELGIELVDLFIKRINYIEVVRTKVYDRMISERNAAAAKIRSEGQGRRAEIEGNMGKELEEIQAEAYRKAQEIKGKADAQVIKIYASAYNNDPEFYSFIKTMDSYLKSVNTGTTLILSTENQYYRYLGQTQEGLSGQ